MHQQFFLQDEKNIPDKILLIDDIYTTGSTLQSAKHTIMKTGKKEIKTFSLARWENGCNFVVIWYNNREERRKPRKRY